MLAESREGAFVRGFSAEKCIKCGKCLSGCHYLKLTPENAREVMTRVSLMPQWYPELAPCIRCGKCDHRCPEDAHPSNLQRECLEYKRREKPGVPPPIEYATNGLGCEGWEPNFFRDIYKVLPKADRKILKSWAAPKKSKDILWIGCTDRMSPRTFEESSTLRDVAKFGGPDDCCGVWAIQGGHWDEGYRIAKRLVNRLLDNRFERLISVCGHCQKVFTRIMPELGITVPFPVIGIYEYILEKIRDGSASVANPMAFDAAVSDSCFGYENGDQYLNSIRDLAEAIGMTVSELPHNREDALCCGYGGLFNDGKIPDIARAARIKRKDFRLAGKKHVVSYCPGCHLINHYCQPGYKSHYLMESVLRALEGRVAEPFSILYRRFLHPRTAWNLAKLTRSAFF